MNMDELPTELLEEILSYLTLNEKFRCERVSRQWQRHVFSSVKTLAFKEFNEPVDQYSDPFLHHHKHEIKKGDWLSCSVNEDQEMLKCILIKCGKNLRSFKGYVLPATMRTIVKYCKRLHCVSMVLFDLQSLQLLGDTFGSQLTCANISSNLKHGIPSFLAACSNLNSFALINPSRSVPYPPCTRPCKACSSVKLFDISSEYSELPKCLIYLRNLVVDDVYYVTQETLKALMLFTNLEMVSINMSHKLNVSSLWRTVIMSWSNIRSLSLKVSHDYCLHLDPLPPDLEYLSLVSKGLGSDNPNCSTPIIPSVLLSNLKTLKLYKHEQTSEHLTSIFRSICSCCPALEDLTLVCFKGLRSNNDEQLAPLLSLSSLKRLSLGEEFTISDTFASKLLTSLEHLTSFGNHGCRVGDSVYDYLIPGGPLFWKSLRNKAISLPAIHFNLIGQVHDTMHFQQPLPPNIQLYPRSRATISLSNGFGRSKNWQEMVCHWQRLQFLTLEINDVNFQSISLPLYTESATIKCLNNVDGTAVNGLSFSMVLPNLKYLTIFQKIMSNLQLQKTLECLAALCPNLRSLDIDRGNAVHEPVDEQVACLVHYPSLAALGVSEKFVITDECGAKFVNEIPTLYKFGCDRRQRLGIQCGSLFLNALASKAKRGTWIELWGGPSLQEIQGKITPVEIPQQLTILEFIPEH